MARYSSAYSSLTRRLTEVETLVKNAEQLSLANPIANASLINAICRGCIVLLSSHIEGYIKDLGELTLDRIYTRKVDRSKIVERFFYHLSKDIVADIKDTSDHDKLAVKLFDLVQRDSALWEKSNPFPDQLSQNIFNQGFSNPKFKKVKKYINRFGYTSYRSDFASALKANFQPTLNAVDHIVDVRNKIAHGDVLQSKTPSDIRDLLSYTRLFCIKTDELFGGWCKSNLCTIR